MRVKLFTLCLLALALPGCLGQDSTYFKPRKPSSPQFPQGPSQQQPPYGQGSQRHQGPKTPQEPTDPDIRNCDVGQAQRIPCGLPNTGGTQCQELNCCFDGQSCFYGKAVTLQCTKDGQFIVVIAKDATLPNMLDLDSVHLLGDEPNCRPVASNSAFILYQFPVSACGTTYTENENSVLTYENRISSSYEVAVGPFGAITRDSHFELLIQCNYIGEATLAFMVEVGTLPAPPPVAAPGPLRVELRLGNGQCTTKGCVEGDVAYNSYYLDSEYPVTKVLRDPVYVEVRMLERTDPNLVLTLGRCWATSDPNPLSYPQWDLLINGCPYRDDRYLSSLVPVDGNSGVAFASHYRRFIFKMFTFVSSGSGADAGQNSKKNPQDPAILTPLRDMIYIHCHTAVCQPSMQNNCEPRCFRKRRDVGVKFIGTEEVVTVSSQAIHFIMNPEQEIM